MNTRTENNSKRAPNAAFTLLELMVVIVIIGLLAGLVGTNVVKYIAKAKVTAAKAQIEMFHHAVESYYIDTNQYPDNNIGLLALIEQPPGVNNWDAEGYLKSVSDIPRDPWDGDYMYQYPGAYSKFDIYSYGADGKEGGEGADMDIYNSDVNVGAGPLN